MWRKELAQVGRLSKVRNEKSEYKIAHTATSDGKKIFVLDEDEKKIYSHKNELIRQHKNRLLKQFANSVNDGRVRNLNPSFLYYADKNTGEQKVKLQNVVSMFESTLSRSFGIATNELTTDIFIVEVFYYDVAQDLIINGFNFNGKHYVYFSSSAGQIRKKKAVFVEEEAYKSCQMKLTCGLTTEKINELGGINVNKFLAYTALANSATDLWEQVFGEPFDIDRTIVVDDFETFVNCKVDHIDYQTYDITPAITEKIPIPHTDGCGMISADYCSKNFMVRLPYIKGLLGSFDYKRFIIENNCSPKIKDIWGKEYDIFEDDIQVIFTKSQLKMHKYYSSWDEYKDNFKKYGCEVGICNFEENHISDAKINYQMLQTLYDATDAEIKELCSYPNRKIKEITDSLDNALDFFGVRLDDDEEINKDWFQKALRIYPELLGDPASKTDLRDLKNSLVKKYRGARLDVTGKFTFVLPDLYAFCEWLFIGQCAPDYAPLGLLEDQEVFCRLYKTADKLDCLRSPHLYIEHAVRINKYNKKYRNQNLRDWFQTDAIYTSTYDPISRILQFDVDGDRLLVIAQKQIIEMAERCTKDVYPLYYEMHKANAELITSQSLYNGLKLAFTGGNIGSVSNNITKIWNNGHIDQEAINVVKWLCMENNFVIDYAKTLFKPTRPEYVDEIIKKYTKSKTPYFFLYAKNKKEHQVEDINNSTINKIVKEIKDNRQMFRPIKNLANIDYTLMLPRESLAKYNNQEINKVFDHWNKKYGNMLVLDEDFTEKNNIVQIAKSVRAELEQIESDEDLIIASLVHFFYAKPSSRKKRLLWYCYGEEIYNNLRNHLDSIPICHKCGRRTDAHFIRGKCPACNKAEQKRTKMKIIFCDDCGRRLEVLARSRSTRCEECREVHRRTYKTEKQREFRKVDKLVNNEGFKLDR